MKQALVGVIALCVIVTGLCATQAQEVQFKVPDGWVVSPENDKQPSEAGYRILHQDTGIEMVFVPGGTFMMGSNDGEGDERPVHEVELSAYWIGRTEVTVGQWRKVTGTVPTGNEQGDDHPVVQVTRSGCVDFGDKLGLRLPTEAEWEYGARGPEGRAYPWGDEWDATKCCNADNQGPGGSTFPVGILPQDLSWCGVLDMAGNVREWCRDFHHPSYYDRSPRLNPQCTAAEAWKVHVEIVGNVPMEFDVPQPLARGGGYDDGAPDSFRATKRWDITTTLNPEALTDLGFRVTRGL